MSTSTLDDVRIGADLAVATRIALSDTYRPLPIVDRDAIIASVYAALQSPIPAEAARLYAAPPPHNLPSTHTRRVNL